MPFTGDPEGKIAARQSLSFFEKALAVGILFVLIGQYVNFEQNKTTQRQNGEIQKTQAEGIIRGYINRAVSCDLAKAIGTSEPVKCDDPKIQPYRDKKLVAGSTASAKASKNTLAVICAITMQTNPDLALALCPKS